MFRTKPKDDASDALDRVKAWVLDATGLDRVTYVVIAELQCTDPGCPPLETVIALMTDPGGPLKRSIHKPLVELTEGDIAGLFADLKEAPQ
jgi:hypothetical protein